MRSLVLCAVLVLLLSLPFPYIANEAGWRNGAPLRALQARAASLATMRPSSHSRWRCGNAALAPNLAISLGWRQWRA